MALLTDGESPMEIEDWEETAKQMNDKEIQLSIVGVDFDDDEMPFREEDKSDVKRENESFYRQFAGALNESVVGTAAFALQECSKPDIKMMKSALMKTTLKVGDVEARPEQAIEIHVRTSKCTAISRPPSMKKFAKRQIQPDAMDVDEEKTFTLLDRKTQYYVEKDKGDGDSDFDEDKAADEEDEEPVEKENLVRGYKYGASFVPVDEDDQFERLEPVKGIEICGTLF
ncbi:hypothetical protein M422DRAFT_275388 [Sphaerobolus stellatus SS14]|uniref:DNA helicase n=1 Tax=Sphaerobolus stellatus (strain SS14) TaxID=990650 RepID=A0A0C9UET3_SPHS4|nr:hypothetical protein M422DRAFT_275388 [Sphaerobolus stellatus SS14]